MSRKKWRLIYPDHPKDVDEFLTEQQAYEFVDHLRDAFWASLKPKSALHDPPTDPAVRVTVQVSEGQGWTTVDHIDFATETAEEAS